MSKPSVDSEDINLDVYKILRYHKLDFFLRFGVLVLLSFLNVETCLRLCISQAFSTTLY